MSTRIPDTGVEKRLDWVASAKKDYLAFPTEVQAEMGMPSAWRSWARKHPHAKPWKGEGPGVLEVADVRLINERLKRAHQDYESGATA